MIGRLATVCILHDWQWTKAHVPLLASKGQGCWPAESGQPLPSVHTAQQSHGWFRFEVVLDAVLLFFYYVGLLSHPGGTKRRRVGLLSLFSVRRAAGATWAPTPAVFLCLQFRSPPGGRTTSDYYYSSSYFFLRQAPRAAAAAALAAAAAMRPSAHKHARASGRQERKTRISPLFCMIIEHDHLLAAIPRRRCYPFSDLMLQSPRKRQQPACGSSRAAGGYVHHHDDDDDTQLARRALTTLLD